MIGTEPTVQVKICINMARLADNAI
uniref:Uncharacterized protein n=1 Tax=Arundo donax TaxID=35708 RepID=A0A0A8Y482_ARUDO